MEKLRIARIFAAGEMARLCRAGGDGKNRRLPNDEPQNIEGNLSKEKEMKTQMKRMERLEREMGMVVRKFYGWPMNPWTSEQAAEAVRRHPEQTVFWRSGHELPVDTEMKMKYPDEDMTGNRAQDWRVREALFHVGEWDDFVAVPVRRMRKGRSWLVFLMAVRRDSVSVVEVALRQAAR